MPLWGRGSVQPSPPQVRRHLSPLMNEDHGHLLMPKSKVPQNLRCLPPGGRAPGVPSYEKAGSTEPIACAAKIRRSRAHEIRRPSHAPIARMYSTRTSSPVLSLPTSPALRAPCLSLHLRPRPTAILRARLALNFTPGNDQHLLMESLSGLGDRHLPMVPRTDTVALRRTPPIAVYAPSGVGRICPNLRPQIDVCGLPQDLGALPPADRRPDVPSKTAEAG